MHCSYVNERIAPLLIHAARGIERQFEEALSTVDLSVPKVAALSVLVVEDQPISLSELAEKLTCVRSNVTQLVDRLEVDGLVTRTDDPSDRRGVRAKVTKLGRERQVAGSKAVNKVHDKVEKKILGIDREVLKRVLAAID
jgi:DNA-binding MarR family transcriptional regulator